MEKDMKFYFELLSLYAELSQKKKDKIVSSLLKNEQRNLDKDNDIESEILKLVDLHNLDNMSSIKKELEKLFSENNYKYGHKDISYKNFVDIMLKEIENICKNIKDEKIRGIALSLFMDKNDILPLIWYAFDKSLFNVYIKEDELIHIIQFSICYLYRLIKVNIDTEGLGEEVGAGAYCKILIDHNKLYKVPLNYAAFFYANMNEWNMYKKICNTRLFKYIPEYFRYHSKSRIIEKEYIYGNTGEQILLRRGYLSFEEKQRLMELYDVISEVCIEKDVLLDIHPNNFIWNVANRQWYLVDLGENQYIGSDYYIMNDFEKYYKKSWIEREMRKKKYPIRSVIL